jgi:hypothetical protein
MWNSRQNGAPHKRIDAVQNCLRQRLRRHQSVIALTQKIQVLSHFGCVTMRLGGCDSARDSRYLRGPPRWIAGSAVNSFIWLWNEIGRLQAGIAPAYLAFGLGRPA